jgi:hypothetical protein
MTKKILYTLLALFVAICLWLSVRFTFGGDEDTWICSENVWVKHGNPSVPQPTGGCGE